MVRASVSSVPGAYGFAVLSHFPVRRRRRLRTPALEHQAFIISRKIGHRPDGGPAVLESYFLSHNRGEAGSGLKTPQGRPGARSQRNRSRIFTCSTLTNGHSDALAHGMSGSEGSRQLCERFNRLCFTSATGGLRPRGARGHFQKLPSCSSRRYSATCQKDQHISTLTCRTKGIFHSLHGAGVSRGCFAGLVSSPFSLGLAWPCFGCSG